MKIIKEANAGGGCQVQGEDLALINALARKELTAEEVYTFTVRLCDNEIDREWERFPEETLAGLAPLFVGKSGIFDHNWSALGQAARIYKTEVVREEGQFTRAGDPGCYLKGWAYMVRTEGSRDLIAEIEGGIKREVSVGCSVEKAVCSVCGLPLEECHHVKGRTYNGTLCWGELVGAKDAYEWSFVAVPAQPRAGVMKGMTPALKALAKEKPEVRQELEVLEKAAALGRRYLEELRGEVVRLMAMSRIGLEADVIRSMTGKLDEEELTALKTVFQRQVEETWPRGAQLSYRGGAREQTAGDRAFLV
ncbi:MAG: hypothetical protein VB096_00485 [Pseudoflavonifractor sp.]|nr:hypothetical protein [Pseudoflavonifractor sp.]